MHWASFSIFPHDLWTSIGTAGAPQIVDVRRREIYDARPEFLLARGDDDHGLLERGFLIYDALFAVAGTAQLAGTSGMTP